MTHPTDDEIICIAMKHGLQRCEERERKAVIPFARALLAEQARTEPEFRSEIFSLLNEVTPLKAEQAKDAAEDAPSDAELLDWLDTTNKRFKMGWKVGVAPAGNCSVQSVIFLGNSEPVTIRAAIRAARAAERKA